MGQAERAFVDRLGARGLRRVLDDVLDPPRLVRLANACGLRYPGMRTQSQSRDRILDDLVDRAQREDPARRAVWRTLVKETAAAAREWSELEPAERDRRLAAAGDPPAVLGLRLFLLAAADDEASAGALPGLLARVAAPAEATPAAKRPGKEPDLRLEHARLKKRNAELAKKLLHLEGQLAKLREAEKTLKRELLHRKGELAESRMLAERLRRDLHDAQASLSATVKPKETAASAVDPLDELTRSVRRLTQDQRKIVHALDRLASTPPAAPAPPPGPDPWAPVREGLEALQRDVGSLRRERKKDELQIEKALETLRADVRALGTGADAAPAARKVASPRKGEANRVGVFVDVQNVYYAARQLKGKLDFDALLLNVVRDRRLIQAKAYVVESQEIDQSGFIAMLQQRNIEVRRKTLRVRSDGSMKGDWDMEMALEILDAAPKLDVIVLVSGDGDFTSLVNRVKAMGPRVEVAAFPRNTAKSLVEAADEFHPLDRKYMIRVGEAPPPREPGRPPAGEGSPQPKGTAA